MPLSKTTGSLLIIVGVVRSLSQAQTPVSGSLTLPFNAENIAHQNQPNGYPKLDGFGNVVWAQIAPNAPLATNLQNGLMAAADKIALSNAQPKLSYVPLDSALLNKPNGVAGLDANGQLIGVLSYSQIINAPAPIPGPPGPQGVPGVNGAIGATGSQGADGQQGLQGPIGIAALTLVGQTGTPLQFSGPVGGLPATPPPAGVVVCGFGADLVQHCLDENGGQSAMVRGISTPASSSDPCAPPQVAYDDTAIYLCVAPNKWKKTANLTSF